MAAFAVGTRRRRVAATVTAAVCMCMAAVCLFDDGSNATNTSDLAVSSSSLLHARVSRNLQSIVGKAVAPEEQSAEQPLIKQNILQLAACDLLDPRWRREG